MKFFHLTPFILQRFIWLPTRLALLVFGKIEIKGVHHLKSIGTNVIFAANHTSEIDSFIVASSVPFWSHFLPVFFASRENKFYDTSGWRQHFYGGTFFKFWGAQAIYAGFQDYEKSLENQINLLKAGKSILMFPEGGITPDGSIQPVRGGIGFLAERSGCIVIPVAISGAFRISLGDFLLRRRKIIIRFGAPIFPEELEIMVKENADPEGNVYKEEAEYIMGKVRELLVQ